MNDQPSQARDKTGGARIFNWILNRRVVANIRWLVSADKDEPLPEKPKHQNLFSKPVAWLLGRQVLASVKWMLLYAAYQGRLDSRNWMRPRSYSFRRFKDEEFWFDYLADSGDGQRAMYSIAYLCLSDLWAEGSVDDPPPLNSPITFEKERQETFRLPRGEFLFVGGDTAYHIADYPTLAYRFQLPFHWAATDLGPEQFAEDKRRPIFGIPGNHDYYDQIEGFHRQFRRPVKAEDMPTEAAPNRKPRTPQLRIPGFKRVQDASYVAIKLPYDWWFWGLDVESGNMDTRQFEFLRKLNNRQPPRKMIVATPEPTTFMGRYMDRDSNLSRVFQDLNLPRPFLKDPELLEPGTCRLDLAGDIHRYARYWGSKSLAAPEETPSNENYASVISGLGGAVIHPWETRTQDVLEQVVYPRTSVCMLLRRIGVTSEHYSYLTLGFWREAIGIAKPFSTVVGYGPFGRSLVILLSLLPLVGALIFGARRTKWLKQQAKERPVLSWEYWPNWLFYGIALIVPEFALWRFGGGPASHVFADVVFAVVVIGLVFGLIYLAGGVGAKGLGKATTAGFLVLGGFHALLQLFPPLLLLRVGSRLSMLLVIVTTVLFAAIGMFLVRRVSSRWVLLLAWLVFGAAVLYLPIALSNHSARRPVGAAIPVFFVAAALIGAINIAVWFGWYLLVSLAFAGHNDEAAGAARVEKYKQFIRFRLTPDTLTGYVVAIDEPNINGRDLKPRIVDVFSIHT